MKTDVGRRGVAEHGEGVFEVRSDAQVGVIDGVAEGFGGERAGLARGGDDHLWAPSGKRMPPISATALSRMAP